MVFNALYPVLIHLFPQEVPLLMVRTIGVEAVVVDAATQVVQEEMVELLVLVVATWEEPVQEPS
jgi:hypothetical protein